MSTDINDRFTADFFGSRRGRPPVANPLSCAERKRRSRSAAAAAGFIEKNVKINAQTWKKLQDYLQINQIELSEGLDKLLSK